MMTLVFLGLMGLGVYRIGKLAVANPGATIRTASWVKSMFSK